MEIIIQIQKGLCCLYCQRLLLFLNVPECDGNKVSYLILSYLIKQMIDR